VEDAIEEDALFTAGIEVSVPLVLQSMGPDIPFIIV
jgi:hypothetical protein